MMTLEDRMRFDIQERLEGMPLSNAKELEPVIKVKDKETAKGFSKEGLPGYFCGNRKAKTVVVNLNPGIGVGVADENWVEDTQSFDRSSVQAFIDDMKTRSENYGNIVKDKPDPFDVKLAAFFYDWEDSDLDLPSMPPAGWDDKSFRLEAKRLILLNKLQLELVPYASATFEINKKEIDRFFPYIETLLDEIFREERTYVVFASAIFDDIFKAYNKKVKDIFHGIDGPAVPPDCSFKKKDGSDMQRKVYCKVITINRDGHRPQKALIAHSIPRKDLQNALSVMQQYGKFCYEKFVNKG